MTPEMENWFVKKMNEICEKQEKIFQILHGDPDKGTLGMVQFKKKVLLDVYGADESGNNITEQSAKNAITTRVSSCEDKFKHFKWVTGTLVFIGTILSAVWWAFWEKIFGK
jgi:hypothetical protein